MSTFLKIDINYLKPADILVSTTNAAVSSIIKVGTHAVVSHAMLYIGNGEVIEAVGKGVRVVTIDHNIKIEGYKNVIAYRYPHLSPQDAEKIVGYALKQNNKGYDYAGLIGAAENADPAYMRANPFSSMLNSPVAFGGQMLVRHFAHDGTFEDPEKYFCSELVFESYQRNGFPLSHEPAYLSNPQQIIDLGVKGTLNYLGNIN